MNELQVKRGICRVLEAAKAEGVRPTAARMNSVTEMTRVEVAVPDERWDADPDILVCANGALDLRTFELVPHDKEHYATQAVPYDYDPDAYCEVWEQRVIAGGPSMVNRTGHPTAPR